MLNAQGHMIPATVLEAGPCPVTGVRTEEKNGYRAVQLGYGSVKEKNLSKASKGNFTKNNLKPVRWLREVRLGASENYEIGQEVKVDIFKPGDLVDVQGRSIGKGFAGGMKRWHWRGGPGSHGSTFHRHVGSVGASSFPSRVWPGLHMPGHMGAATITIQNLEVIKVDAPNNLLVLKGSVPGGDNQPLLIRRSLKRPMGVVIKAQEQKAKDKKDAGKKKPQEKSGGKK